MKKLALICLINVLLMAGVSIPAEAKISVGLVTSALPVNTAPSTISNLEKALSKAARDTVKVRQFKDEAEIAGWLLRFQEIDAAIVTGNFIKQHPAGALSHLADLHHSTKSKSPLALTVRHNLGANTKDKINKAFLSLSKDDSGLKALNNLGLAGVTLPGKALARKPAKKAAPITAKPVSGKTTKVVSKPQRAAKQPAERTGTTAKPAPAPTPKTTIEKKPAPAVVAQPSAAPTIDVTAKSTAKKEAETTSIVLPEPEDKSATPATSKQPSDQKTKAEKKSVAIKEVTPKKQEIVTEVSKKVKKEDPRSKRLTVFLVLIIIAAISIKIALIALKWKSKQRANNESQSTPAIDNALHEEVKEPLKPAEQTDTGHLVIEEGVLGPGKVPELLKRCADLPRPVVLKTKKGGSEKYVFFAGGQVSGAVTQNTPGDSGVRWNKLGSLLVREKLITSEERDQGMALLTKDPELRLGEALLKLGLINLDGLRHALTRQAKATIYSLILFPEGHYQVIDEVNSLPPEESVSLEVTSLLREASHHQSEWTAIRQTLPNLNKKLQFSSNGQGKLEKVNLAPQQERTLALVDGQKTINDLCAESSMLDYEVYRFLYLMVKTEVLQ